MRHPESFLELLKIDADDYPVIAVVGGGGKTSLIHRLTEELTALGKKVIITTTTHMAYEPGKPFAKDGDMDEVRRLLEKYGYTFAAALPENSVKMESLSQEHLQKLKTLCDVMLIEADGSRQKPLKVPAQWEPVIPPFADIVISVVGLDCLGKPIRETAHRMERTSEFLRKGLDAPVTAEDVIKIASSICGLFKNVEDRIYRVYLNKADVLEDTSVADEILRELEKMDTVAAYGVCGDAQFLAEE